MATNAMSTFGIGIDHSDKSIWKLGPANHLSNYNGAGTTAPGLSTHGIMIDQAGVVWVNGPANVVTEIFDPANP